MFKVSINEKCSGCGGRRTRIVASGEGCEELLVGPSAIDMSMKMVRGTAT